MTTQDIIFKLENPLTLDGAEYTQFTFKEPTMEDLMQAEKMSGNGTHEINLNLMSIISSTHLNVMRKLPVKIYYKMKEALDPFFI